MCEDDLDYSTICKLAFRGLIPFTLNDTTNFDSIGLSNVFHL